MAPMTTEQLRPFISRETYTRLRTIEAVQGPAATRAERERLQHQYESNPAPAGAFATPDSSNGAARSHESLGASPAAGPDAPPLVLRKAAPLVPLRKSAPVPVRERAPKPERAAVEPGTEREVKALLDSIPNNGPTDYEWYFKMIAATHDATGGSDEGLELANEWSRRNPEHVEGFLEEKIWQYARSDREKKYTIETLRAEARKHVNVADDFEVLPPLDEADTTAEKSGDGNVVPWSEFGAKLAPPSYIWHYVLQRRCLYALTAKWGHAKTALMITLLLYAAVGRDLGGRRMEKCSVLYLCGENPDDVRLRVTAGIEYFGIKPEELSNVYFTQRPFSIDKKEQLVAFLQEAQPHAPFGLVVIDTGPAHSAAEEENDNREMHMLAIAMRALIDPLGSPAVVALMHPTKEATRENLQPRGGGAFSGSIDGELCAWNTDGIVEFFHRTKFRGPGFAPIFFKLEKYELPGVTDNFGEPVRTIVAVETTKAASPQPPKKLTGNVEMEVWRTLNEIVEFGGGNTVPLARLHEHIEPRLAGDRQRFRVDRAVEGLQAKNYLRLENGVVELLERQK